MQGHRIRPSRHDDSLSRKARLAGELRANLAKRKAQARVRERTDTAKGTSSEARGGASRPSDPADDRQE
jgi:hypothetical protein